MRVRFTQDYSSRVGTWRKGEVIDVDATFAAWLMRDAGVEEVEPDPQPRQQPAAKNRQVTTPKRTRQRKVDD